MNQLLDFSFLTVPEHFVDPLDVDELKFGAYELLRDHIVKRKTEFERFRDLFIDAMKKNTGLLPSQEETLQLKKGAEYLGLNPAAHISNVLGISLRAAYYRLETLSKRMQIITISEQLKTFNYNDSMAIHSNTHTITTISTDDIDNVVKGRWVDCKTKPYVDDCTGRAPARFGICRTCYDTFNNRKWYPDGMPEWVRELINSSRREARQEAREYLFQQRHGINMDISDIA